MRDLKKFLDDFWREGTADKAMAELTVKALYALIDMELQGARRQSVLLRLHRRLCTQRALRERADLAKNKLKWRV